TRSDPTNRRSGGQTVAVRRAFSAVTEASPDDLFDVVGDLTTYPHWLDVVSEAEPTDEDDEAWLVTLRARVGPFSRSKRLRMVRAVHARAPSAEVSTVRFERRETDGRRHSDWVLGAEVGPAAQVGPAAGGDGPMISEVRLELIYDGSMWSGMLDGVLGAAADRATAKLQAYVKP
ncbi:MAG: SRPBCC family protein, partial [Acidimicrobiales bacterium]